LFCCRDESCCRIIKSLGAATHYLAVSAERKKRKWGIRTGSTKPPGLVDSCDSGSNTCKNVECEHIQVYFPRKGEAITWTSDTTLRVALLVKSSIVKLYNQSCKNLSGRLRRIVSRLWRQPGASETDRAEIRGEMPPGRDQLAKTLSKNYKQIQAEPFETTKHSFFNFSHSLCLSLSFSVCVSLSLSLCVSLSLSLCVSLSVSLASRDEKSSLAERKRDS
jgi:hypothetical protein